MGCCGQKRAQLVESMRLRREPPTVAKTDASPPIETSARVFEYLGVDTLTLVGAASGTTYRFTHPGAQLEVAYEDSFAMMAEHKVRALRE